MTNDLKIEYLPIEKLTPYSKNARKHADEDVSAIVASIKKFGFADPIGVWGKKNTIVEGHGRLMAAKELGMTEVPVLHLDWMTDQERKAYALAHNRTAELSEWDFDILGDALAEIDFDMTQFGFDADDEEETEIVEDEVPEVNEDEPPITQKGDLWLLGDHRLMCGDATNADDVARLMDGLIADISITSPPYGMGDNAKLRDHYDKNKAARKTLYLEHKDEIGQWGALMRDSFQNMQHHSQAQFINVEMIANNKLQLIDFLYDNADKLADIMVWDKKKAAPQMQKNVLNNRFEFIFIFENGNNSRSIPFADFHGDISNVIELPHGKNEYADIHRAVYPVELPTTIMQIARYCTSVFDPFGGTGTTLIAAEQTGRKCYTMELDPRYCDVIVKRWEQLTGKQACKVEK